MALIARLYTRLLCVCFGAAQLSTVNDGIVLLCHLWDITSNEEEAVNMVKYEALPVASLRVAIPVRPTRLLFIMMSTMAKNCLGKTVHHLWYHDNQK